MDLPGNERARDSGNSITSTDWRPTEQEQQTYAYLFSKVDSTHTGIVQGHQAVPFFQKSGLPDATLGVIWQQADTGSKGHLSSHEFSIAMKLISLMQAHKPARLDNLYDETPLPDLQGIALPASSPVGHRRRDSTTSSIGFANILSAGSSTSLSEDIGVTEQEKTQYRQIFEKSGPMEGCLSGEAARAMFMKTKLSADQLAKIWELADPRMEGRLRLPGFIVAMHYIRLLMKNRSYQLPAVCPVAVWRSAGGDMPMTGVNMSPQGSFNNMSTPDLSPMASEGQWDVMREEQIKYEKFFRDLDKEHLGYLAGDVPVKFFLKSKLPETVLSKIWDLADTNRNGRLTMEEFMVAMHLINGRLAGKEIPDTLPAGLVPPSMRKGAMPTSHSVNNLSPPAIAKERSRHLMETGGLKRSTTFSPKGSSGHMFAASGRTGSMPTGMGRTSTASNYQSPKSFTSSDEPLQEQVNQLEDMSRGLQTQRSETLSRLAITGSHRQELELKISTLEASHEAESRINRDLDEKLKVEQELVEQLQGKVSEATQRLTQQSDRRIQLEDEVNRVENQHQHLQQKLEQMQEDSRQLDIVLAELEQEKLRIEQMVGETEKRLEGLEMEVKQKEQQKEELEQQRPTSWSFEDAFGIGQEEKQQKKLSIEQVVDVGLGLVKESDREEEEEAEPVEADPFEEFLQTNSTEERAKSEPSPSVDNTPPAQTKEAVPESPKSDEGAPPTKDGDDSKGGFDADFTTAFGMMPENNERAVNKELETFESKFPDIGAITKEATANTKAGEELTFESVFGKDQKDKDFVPPPVTKRTNVSARPMSRVLSIFRSSSKQQDKEEKPPALPKPKTKDFEEEWKSEEWPDWVKRGEYQTERRRLMEMGYSKDRIVQALEVNDFNLVQASDYLLSSF